MSINLTNKLALVFAMMFMMLHAGARDIVVSKDGQTAIKVELNTYQQLHFSNSLDIIRTLKVDTERGVFTQLGIEGYSSSLRIGDPRLPVNRKMIEIPFGAEPRVNITGFRVEEYRLEDLGIYHPIIPAQPPMPKDGSVVPFEYNKETYQRDEFTQTELVSVEVLGQMRGLRIGRIDIAPVQYNPVKGIIRVYSEVEAEIIFEGADVMTTLEEKKKNAAPHFRSVGASLLNYKYEQTSSRDTLTRYPVKYVIVSDPMFEAQLQPFIEWKTKKGFTVVEAYTDEAAVGNTTSSIKAYLEGLYDSGTPSDPAPSFVLFVGDVAQIPSWSGNAGWHVTDMLYVEYTGDYFPEVYFGRWSANNTTELQPQIDKTLQYEQYLMPDPSYLDEVVMVAGMDAVHGHDYGNGQINYGTENYFNAAHGLTSHTYLYPESGSHSADIIQNVSDGVSFGNYTAHCSSNGWANPSFTISDVSTLQNQDEYCILIGNCCSSNEFDNTCFGEALLRAEDKGALGYIGGTNSTYWDEDYYFGVGVGAISEDPPLYSETTLGNYDRSFHDHGEPWEDWYATTYEIIFAGNLAVTEGVPSSAEYYWEIYCVMGDPSVMCYYGVPDPLTVSYDALMPMGATSFTINTEPYAYAAISKDGVLHGAALADAGGVAIVNLDPIMVAGEADVVVTKQNAQPYMGTVQVGNPSGPYVLLNEYTVNDSLNNNNGVADYSETISLDVILENQGSSDANDVSAQLVVADEYVSITDDYAAFGTIAPGNTSTQDDAYVFEVDSIVPDQHQVSFTLEITGTGKDSWSSDFEITLHAPFFALGAASVDDSQGGNGDGRLDPGETADIIVPVMNAGHCDAMNTLAEMSSSNPDIIFNNSSTDMGVVSYGSTEDAVFSITVDENIDPGTSVPFEFFVDAEGYTAELGFFKVVGQIPVLIVDLDPNYSSGPVMKNSLDNLNIGVDYMTAMPGDLHKYSSVFVCLGVFSANHILTAQEGEDLADYLDGGGKLYMEGGDTWYYNPQTAVHPMFGINGTDDGDDDLGTLLGQAGTFTDGMVYDYVGENRYIDHIEPTGDAFSIFLNQDLLVTPYITGIANVGPNYKTIGVSHEFGGLAEGVYSKDYLMFKYLEFFDIDAVWVGVEDNTLSESDIMIYPNPARGNASIVLTAGGQANVSLSVFNSTGQEVYRLADQVGLAEGQHIFNIETAKLSGGIYYCVFTSGEQRISRKLVVIE